MLSGTDLPQTPSEISILREGDKYVFCVGESQAIYSNKLDSPNQSNCYGKCSELWPPVIAKGGGARVGSGMSLPGQIICLNGPTKPGPFIPMHVMRRARRGVKESGEYGIKSVRDSGLLVQFRTTGE